MVCMFMLVRLSGAVGGRSDRAGVGRIGGCGFLSCKRSGRGNPFLALKFVISGGLEIP